MNVQAVFYWDPSPFVCDIPIPGLGRPILWYGFFFTLGVALGYIALRKAVSTLFLPSGVLPPEERSRYTTLLSDKIASYVLISAIVGARLGDVLLYQPWHAWLLHPWTILYFWEGGLASHGATVAILLALWVLSKRFQAGKYADLFPHLHNSVHRDQRVDLFHFFRFLDVLVFSICIVAAFVRIGNFFNQEIVGLPTLLPWGVIFAHPKEVSEIVARHPVQLYEAASYIITLLLLWRLQKCRFIRRNKGKLSGCFCLIFFGFRILAEFCKVEQSAHISSSSPFHMGQYLSVPIVIFGAYLLLRKDKRSC